MDAFLDPGPFLQEFGCLMAYFSRNGHKSRALLRVFAQYVPFVPFLLAFARVVDGAPVTQLDLAILMEVLAVIVTSAWPVIPLPCVYEFMGATLSNLVRVARGPEPPITHTSDEVIGDFYGWDPDTGGRPWVFGEGFPQVMGISGGPFDPVSDEIARRRTTMTIVRIAKERGILAVAKNDTGRRILYTPRQGSTNWEKEGGVEVPAEATIVLIDDSWSMKSVVESMGKRKSVVARDLAREFFEGLKWYAPHAVYGCATFSGAAELKLRPALPDIPEAQAGGQAGLWNAIRSAVGLLQSSRKSLTKAKLRIFVISDGEDSSGERPFPAAESLFAEHIILDVILLPSAEDPIDRRAQAPLLALAIASGGCALSADSRAGNPTRQKGRVRGSPVARRSRKGHRQECVRGIEEVDDVHNGSAEGPAVQAVRDAQDARAHRCRPPR